MKLQPIFLITTLSFSGVAAAQSSVTLFGVTDATLSRGTGTTSDRTQMLRGGLSSNRLGFRGAEDLGGGLTAGFWLEAGFNLDDGEGQASNTNNQASGAGVAVAGRQGLTFNRRSTVSLANQWGEIRAGRDFTPQYLNHVIGDVFGSVGVGSAVNYTQIITGPTSTRASNMVGYFSPKLFGSLSAHVSHYLGGNPSGTATSKDGNGSGIRLLYDDGQATFGVAYGRTDYAAGATIQRTVAGSYNFGVAKIMGVYNNDRSGGSAASGFALGGSIPVGVGEFKASYSRHNASLTTGSPSAKKWGLGYVHHLSKRTAIYSTYARLSNSGGLAAALNGATTEPNTSSSGLDIGLRQIF